MEYKQEQYILNKFCEFSNKEVEFDFMEYEKTASLNIVRLMVLLMGFIFALFAFSDYYFYGNGKAFIISLALRGAALFIVIITFSFASSHKSYNRILAMITVTELTVFFIYLLNLYLLKTSEPTMQFMSVMLFILTAFLIPNLWKNSLLAGCTILGGYLVYCSLLGGSNEMPTLSQRALYLGICLVSCAIFIYARENSRRKQFATEKLLEYMSITDRLTGIYNRGRFEYILGLWIKNMRHDPFCLLLFDIDDFKKVNDLYGHSAGDMVLVDTTKIISSNIRDEDIFARWGGEEFVILFGDANLDKAGELAERLRNAVEAYTFNDIGKITISIGIAQYHRTEMIFEFVNRADEKMYEAKKNGKNRIAVEIPKIKERTALGSAV